MAPLLQNEGGRPEESMAPETGFFDVKVRFVPTQTPSGEDFAPALARVFGVELWVAEHLVRHAPIFVKRGVGYVVARRLCATLEGLGAGVDILEAAGERRTDPVSETGAVSGQAVADGSVRAASWPPGFPSIPPPEPARTTTPPPGQLRTDSVPARTTTTSPAGESIVIPPSLEAAPPPPAALPSEWTYPSPPPRRSYQSPPRSAPPPASTPSAPPMTNPYSRAWSAKSPPPRDASTPPPTLLPSAPPTTRTWIPLPPQPPRRRIGGASIVLGAVVAVAIVFGGVNRWLRSLGDAKLLGNTPTENTIATQSFGLTGPGLAPEQRTKLTLVVAWREGCLGDDYARFLRDLGEAHRGELTIVGAGLAVPAQHDPRALGRPPEAPPDPWPPRGCAPPFEVIPTSRGYVGDFLPAPATYLYDADGSLIAAWRGGMSPQQRENLVTWLDGRTLER